MSIILIKNAENQACTKQINIQQHYICKLVADEEIKIKLVCSANILINSFIKALTIDNLQCH